ncbi:MAG TPA: GNAT family N-acetyltransferase [Caulobacteraceae bacterium]|jgi:ribosomal protein S18 acetylase RimI-like enzyme
MTDVRIRRAVGADAEALAELGARTFTEAFGHLYPKADLDDFLAANHTPAKTAAALADVGVAIWVAEANEGLVGYSQAGPADMPHPELRPEHGELKRLYILRSHQNLGLGARLIEPALAWLEAAGRTPVWISVWSENRGAQRFYARYGFEKVGEYEFAVGAWRDPEFIYRRGIV